MEKKIALSEEKQKDLENELKKLEKEKMPEISETLEHAREDDVSEDTGSVGLILQEKERLQKKIGEIKEILSKIVIIPKKRKCTPGKIEIGSEIKVQFKGKTQKMKVVSSVESDPLKGLISEDSPLGKALLKGKAGSTIKLKINGKDLEYKILEVC